MELDIIRNHENAFHITTSDHMESICKKGLIPMLGERSLSVDEPEKRLFLFRDMIELFPWIEALYPDRDPSELEVLKFSLYNRKIYWEEFEYYSMTKVRPERIEYLRLYNEEKGEYLPVGYEASGSIIEWKPLSEYKPLTKRPR